MSTWDGFCIELHAKLYLQSMFGGCGKIDAVLESLHGSVCLGLGLGLSLCSSTLIKEPLRRHSAREFV